MRRTLLFSCLLLVVAGPVRAESVLFTLDFSGPVAEGPEAGSLNRVHATRMTDGRMRRAMPVVVLLPPDIEGRPQVQVEPLDCTLVPGPESRPRTLRELSTGRVLALPEADWEVSWRAQPMATEGAARVLPLLVFGDHLADSHGALLRCSSVQVAVTFEPLPEPLPERGHYTPGRLLRSAVNPEDWGRWYRDYERRGEVTDYVVVTREAFADKSKHLQAFLDWKAEQGFSPLLKTYEAIADEVNDPELAPQEVLRTWLQSHYQEDGIEYLLLLGSPNLTDEGTLPMKQCWPSEDYEDPTLGLYDVPTDMYYADLTGNWNPDGDEKWCELEDYMELPDEEPEGDRLDGVDLVPELMVGRMPHFGTLPYYADNTLARTIAYQQGTPEPWHNRALLPSPQVCFPDGGYVDGSEVSTFLIDHSLAENGITSTILGEWDGELPSAVPGVQALTADSLVEHWDTGYGSVFWCAHGNQEGAYRNVWLQDDNSNMRPEQGECDHPSFISNLTYKVASGDYPPVVFQGSCLTADPYANGNLTHTLLQHMTVANVASTRVTMGMADDEGGWEPSPYSPGAFSLGVYFIHGAVAKRVPVAEAFNAAEATLGFGVQPWTLKVRLEFNLYGDPSLRLPGCDEDGDCTDGDPCNGTEHCEEGRCHRSPAPSCEDPPEAPGPCRVYQCVPSEGCVFVQQPDWTYCEVDDPCLDAGSCHAGECVTPGPKTCPPPPSDCWLSTCDPESGQCCFEPRAEGASCDLGKGTCQDGSCNATTPEPTPADITPHTDAPTLSGEADDGTGERPTADTGCRAGTSPRSGAWCLFVLLLGLAGWRIGRREIRVVTRRTGP